MGWSVRRLLSWSLLFTAGGLLLSRPVQAFPEPVDFDGSLSRWNIGPSDAPVTYGIDADVASDGEAFQSATDAAAELWNQTPGSYFRYAKVADGQSPQVTIHLQSSLNGTRSTAGYTYFDKYAGDKPVHCMIVILVDDSIAYGSIAKTILHEMGHGLGLGHSLIPEAIMSYSLRKNTFGLDVDDHAAVTRLYPLSGHRPKLPPGCAVGASQEGQTNWLLLAMLLAPVLLAVLLQRGQALSRWPASGRWRA